MTGCTVETVIVDEIHALVRDKRGSHLGATLERWRPLPASAAASAFGDAAPIDEMALPGGSRRVSADRG